MSSFIAAGTAYATHGVNTIPFFIFYSMFGFQRIGDLIWAAADSRTRGFMLGGTAGRTTLAGEGLQHQDGNSHLLAYPVPNIVAYDPAFAYEIAVIIQDGIRRMYVDQESIFYYLTVMNEQYAMPPMPEGVARRHPEGAVPVPRRVDARPRRRARSCSAAAPSCRRSSRRRRSSRASTTSAPTCGASRAIRELYRDGHACERWNMLHPGETPRVPYVTQCLKDAPGVLVAASDYVKALPDSIDRWLPRPLTTLGTDGFGRSESRAGAARVLRGRLPLRRRRDAGRAGARGHDRRCRSCSRRSRRTTSIRRRRIPRPRSRGTRPSCAGSWRGRDRLHTPRARRKRRVRATCCASSSSPATRSRKISRSSSSKPTRPPSKCRRRWPARSRRSRSRPATRSRSARRSSRVDDGAAPADEPKPATRGAGRSRKAATPPAQRARGRRQFRREGAGRRARTRAARRRSEAPTTSDKPGAVAPRPGDRRRSSTSAAARGRRPNRPRRKCRSRRRRPRCAGWRASSASTSTRWRAAAPAAASRSTT